MQQQFSARQLKYFLMTKEDVVRSSCSVNHHQRKSAIYSVSYSNLLSSIAHIREDCWAQAISLFSQEHAWFPFSDQTIQNSADTFFTLVLIHKTKALSIITRYICSVFALQIVTLFWLIVLFHQLVYISVNLGLYSN